MRFLSILAASLLACCAQAGPAPDKSAHSTAKEERPIMAHQTIVMLGDSLTAGFLLPPDQALPNVVQRNMQASGLDVTLINSGVSGDTTADALARYEESVTQYKPDWLVIALGTNDFLRGVPAQSARANLVAMIERAESADISVVLVGIEPAFAVIPDEIEQTYAVMLHDLAAERNLPFHPAMMKTVWGEPEYLMRDGLHPNAAGVEVMATRLSETLTRVIAD